MNIGNDDSYIKLDYRDATPERYQDDIALSVELVHVAGFNGRNESVWFGRAERASFLSDLHFLEQSRRGQSRLVAIGAQSEFDTFVLEISAQGPGSRLIVSADLIAPYYIANKLKTLRASVSFELDGGYLPSIIKDFTELFDASKHGDSAKA